MNLSVPTTFQRPKRQRSCTSLLTRVSLRRFYRCWCYRQPLCCCIGARYGKLPSHDRCKVSAVRLRFLSGCSDLLVSTEEIPGDRFFKQGSGWSKTGTMRLREFCGSQFCFVVL